MKLNTRWIRALDFTLAAGSLLYGVTTLSGLWIAGGLLGLVVAWWNPAARIQQYLFRRLRRVPSAEARASGNFPIPPAEPLHHKRS